MGQLIRAECKCGFHASDILFDSGEGGHAYNYACYQCKSIFSIIKRRPKMVLPSLDKTLRGVEVQPAPKIEEAIICPTCKNEFCDVFYHYEYSRLFPEARPRLMFKKRMKVRKIILSAIGKLSHKLYLKTYRFFDFLLESDYLGYCPACMRLTCRLYDAGSWD